MVRPPSLAFLLMLIAPLSALAPEHLAFASTGDISYQIKTSYIYNILQFVQFPDRPTTSANSLNVCIVGENRFDEALNEIQGAALPQGKINVLELGSNPTQQALQQCAAVFIVKSNPVKEKRILSKIDLTRVLTIGESPEFIEHGGLIELYEENDVIRFRINENQVNKTTFTLDAQLVQLGVHNAAVD